MPLENTAEHGAVGHARGVKPFFGAFYGKKFPRGAGALRLPVFSPPGRSPDVHLDPARMDNIIRRARQFEPEAIAQLAQAVGPDRMNEIIYSKENI